MNRLIKDEAYREYFMHRTGHWLGIDVHDAGRSRFGSQGRPLEPGMAFTVEPGVYIARDKATVTLSHADYDPDERLRLPFELGAAGAREEIERRNAKAGTFEHELPAEYLGLGVRIDAADIIGGEPSAYFFQGPGLGLSPPLQPYPPDLGRGRQDDADEDHDDDHQLDKGEPLARFVLHFTLSTRSPEIRPFFAWPRIAKKGNIVLLHAQKYHPVGKFTVLHRKFQPQIPAI